MLFILGDLAQEIITNLSKEAVLQFYYQTFISSCFPAKKGIILGIKDSSEIFLLKTKLIRDAVYESY